MSIKSDSMRISNTNTWDKNVKKSTALKMSKIFILKNNNTIIYLKTEKKFLNENKIKRWNFSFVN